MAISVSIQIGGLRVPCVSHQTTDLFFGAGDKQGRLRYHRQSTLGTHRAALSLELCSEYPINGPT